MDTTQIIILIMISVLGITLVGVGVMVALLIKDLRESINRVNQILDDVGKVSENIVSGSTFIEETLATIRDSISSVKEQISSPLASVLGLFTFLQKMKKRKGGE